MPAAVTGTSLVSSTAPGAPPSVLARSTVADRPAGNGSSGCPDGTKARSAVTTRRCTVASVGPGLVTTTSRGPGPRAKPGTVTCLDGGRVGASQSSPSGYSPAV